MRGVESLFFYFLLVVLVFGFSAFFVFELISGFKRSHDVVSFWSGLDNVVRVLDFLSVSGSGSFERVGLVVPSGFSVFFENSSIRVVNSSGSFVFPVNVVFNESYGFSSGEYELVFCKDGCPVVDFLVVFHSREQ